MRGYACQPTHRRWDWGKVRKHNIGLWLFSSSLTEMRDHKYIMWSHIFGHDWVSQAVHAIRGISRKLQYYSKDIESRYWLIWDFCSPVTTNPGGRPGKYPCPSEVDSDLVTNNYQYLDSVLKNDLNYWIYNLSGIPFDSLHRPSVPGGRGWFNTDPSLHVEGKSCLFRTDKRRTLISSAQENITSASRKN